MATPASESAGPRSGASHVRRNAAIFVGIVAVWLIIDQVSKLWFDAFSAGELISEPVAGVVGLRLVRNTGGAWGAFDGMTIALAIFSVILCVAILAYLFLYAKDATVMLTVGLSLVFAGGVGNIIDRFTHGYVIDFIQPLFIDFPVFNVADIGVTCGIVIALCSLFASGVREETEKGSE